MEFAIRALASADRTVWAQMRAQLWPEETAEDHARWIADKILTDAEIWGFIAEAPDGVALGFVEISVRKYANGCETAPVPFLEGIWVRDESRRLGIGARLIRHAEDFLIARGYRELGSDALLDNTVSHESHRRWGFIETERVVYSRKSLGR